MDTLKYVTIDDQQILIESEKNILELIRKANIELPTFCYHSELSVYGACRLCIVEVNGKSIQASCSLPPEPGMSIKTNTGELRNIRKVNLELLLANHDISCPSCERSNNCKLQELSSRLGVSKIRFKKTNKTEKIDNLSPSLVYDANKCVLCGDCVRACKEIQSVGAIDFTYRGASTKVAPAFGKSLAEVECVYCGRCVSVCPVGALTPKQEVENVWNEIFDKKKTVIAQIAPAVRVALGEMFGMPSGSLTIGQIVTAMKKMGFNYVFDTSFAADLTVIEETNEFISRKVNGGVLPLFTSCCPSWVKFAEQYYPELLSNLSTCKSPQQMFGSVARSIYAKTLQTSPEDLVIVSVMPCTSKKFEAKRPEFSHDGLQDVNHVITTSELGKMIKESGINFTELTPSSLDLPMGFKTGAGLIFGNSGGVTEAVLRYAGEKLSGETLQTPEFKEVRNTNGMKELQLTIAGHEYKFAIVNGLANARKVCEKIKNGEVYYDFVEVMACPSGCIAGGGQPVCFDQTHKEKRRKGLYDADKMVQLHKSQQNPFIKELYDLHLVEPNSHVAHELLHTHYKGRKRIQDTSIQLSSSPNSVIDVEVCVGTNCFLKGSHDILKKSMAYISENNMQSDVNVAEKKCQHNIQASFCFEKCEKGPIVRVNSMIIENATFQKVQKAIDNVMENIKTISL